MRSSADDLFPVVYSTIDPSAIRSRILSRYDIEAVKVCEFWCRGLSDVYLVETDRGSYILRIAHWGWRSQADIDFELALLKFLHDRGLPVAHPLRTESGKLSIAIPAPEGERYAALFTYALGGVPIGDLSIRQATRLGETLAKVHQTGLAFECSFEREPLTLDYLLDESWTAIAPFLQRDDREYVESAIAQIKTGLKDFPRSSPYWGICWGDPHSGNTHFTEADQPTLFDFDQCGFGWRAFDLGKFRQVALNTGISRRVREAFLQGYRSMSPLEEFELAAISAFTQTAHIWVWSISLTYALRHNYSRLDDSFFRKRVEQLRKLKSPDWQMF
ncbi:homoserine kinase [Leptolyngbya sp. NIES-2104]|uniref:homoserine kinase n=1 Tax=Leptolyngbya sp. NIES-2104 TaxID=1552121 RepID=UPI0006ECB9F5|nr:homoserine kinase [Leptolyngbya sp. NIES-2104]GAP99410.1 homoserine kinase [Leptolyngbya sp. NIES-2104]